MSADLMERLSNLEKLAEQIGNNTVDRGSEIAGDRLNVEGGMPTFSYFETESDSFGPMHLTKSEMARLQRAGRRNRLPKGYKPQFKSFSDFLRSGYRQTASSRCTSLRLTS